MQQERRKHKHRWAETVVVICIILIFATLSGVFLWRNHINKLHDEMNEHLETAISYLEQGDYSATLTEIDDALILAQKLRDEDAIYKIEIIINLTETQVYADELFFMQDYQAALEEYLIAADKASGIPSFNTYLIETKIAETAKRAEAASLFSQGEQYYSNEKYTHALIYFYSAKQIFLELDDHQNMDLTQARIDVSEQKIAEMKIHEPPADDSHDNTHDNTQDDQIEHSEVILNYLHNSSLDFDLRTLIDNQNRAPANQVRMGSTEGMNEGWYNGCGWVATYNALILLGDPKHPAVIVRNFEESGGTVLGGVFGTYPNTIAEYIKSLGFNVDHTLFPQLTINIDDAIKASRVSILAYVHTNAAHYVAVEYNEEIEKFIVYNDSFARARSAELGLESYTRTGAAVDSIADMISNTRDILISFSLIVVN